MSTQRLLPLVSEPAFESCNFIESSANILAVSALQKWPSPFIFLHGPRGCGKTHLAHVWQKTCGAFWTNAAQMKGLDVEYLMNNPRPVILHDLPLSPTPEQETLYFNLYNILKQTSQKLLITAPFSPTAFEGKLPDLKTRLLACLSIQINEPDDDLLEGILRKRFADLQLCVDDRSLKFLMHRIERSYAALHTCIALLYAAALSHKQRVSIPLIKACVPLDHESEIL